VLGPLPLGRPEIIRMTIPLVQRGRQDALAM